MTMHVDPASLAEPIAPKRRTKKTGGGARVAAPDRAIAVAPPASPSIGSNQKPICHEFLSEPYQQIIVKIVELHRLRQGLIKAQTKLALQGRASLRRLVANAGEWGDKEALERTKKKVETLYAEVVADPAHPYHVRVMPYLLASEPLVAHRIPYEKDMVRLARKLPVYPWVKGVHGLGDMSFATIVGEAGDLGKYRDHSALWKRLGMAVIDGARQGNPGANASKELWIWHGYSKTRRSTVWNAGNGVIGGMGRGPRLMPGEDPDDRDDLSPYQKLFVHRIREEAPSAPFKADKVGNAPAVKIADNGKESFSKYAAARAKRYVEKKMLRDLYNAWRETKA